MAPFGVVFMEGFQYMRKGAQFFFHRIGSWGVSNESARLAVFETGPIIPASGIPTCLDFENALSLRLIRVHPSGFSDFPPDMFHYNF